jgi:hypothetical protein
VKKRKKTKHYSSRLKVKDSGDKKLDFLLKTLFFVGLILLVWQIFIYRRTIIDLNIPLFICFTPGLILTPLFFKKLNYIDGTRGHWTLHYLFHTITVGGIILFCFMSSNFYLANNVSVQSKFKIIDRGSLPGRKRHRDERSPYVIINYNGMNKQLIFSYEKMDEVMAAKYLLLKVKKGLWGFDILDEYTVK